MFTIHRKAKSPPLAAACLALGALIIAGAGARAQRAAPDDASKAAAPPQGALFAPHAWSRADVYEAPDFERFFPDDREGGKALDALCEDKDRDRRPDAEILQAARRGLRRAQKTTQIISWIGNRYIWGRSPQDPDAIEILYHAADPSIPGGDGVLNGIRHYSIYFGLSVVEPKPAAILRTLVDLCMDSEDPNSLDRVAWGTRSQRAETLAHLKPYLEAEDAATRGKADDLAKILSGDIKAFERAAKRNKFRARLKYASRLPEIEKALEAGNSRERREALELISNKPIASILDASSLPAFRACAEDGDASVRRHVAAIVGRSWIWGAAEQDEGAIAIELKLAQDKDPEVRSDAVNYGLARVLRKREDVTRALLGFALAAPPNEGYQAALERLKGDRKAPKILKELLEGAAPAPTNAAQLIALLIVRDPMSEPLAAEANAEHARAFTDLYQHLGQAYPNFAMKGIDWAEVGQELLPRATEANTERAFGLLVEELVARLEDSHAVVLQGTAKPPMPELPQWDPGLACLIDDRGRPVVYEVVPGSPLEKAGVKPGMTIASINGVPAEEALNRWMQRQRRYVGYSSDRALRYDAARGIARQDEEGAEVSLALEDPDGLALAVKATADYGPRYHARLPVPRKGINDSADVSWAKLDDGIGYIYVRRIRQGLEQSIDMALRELGELKGLIIDVRGNSGGGFDPSTAFRNFDTSADDKAEPDRPRHRGPIALLIDERCISAGEGWASWFVARKRARTFGATTAGASSRKETYELSNKLYRIVVPIKAYTGSLDRPIERRGLEPDVEVRCSARDISLGKDTVAEKAAAWLADPGRE